MTVCEVSRNNALRRDESVIDAGQDPGDGVTLAPGLSPPVVPSGVSESAEASDQLVDIELIARDQIERWGASVFTGHDFSRLVGAILNAQGYVARVTPPGADNGVDIVAGSGFLGLESPRPVVQVKSGNMIVDQPSLQGLISSIQDTQADHGLIVSWAGFTGPVKRRLNELYFAKRALLPCSALGRDELMDNLLGVYEQLPEDIRAELPLARMWSLVVEGADSAEL